MRFAPSSDPDAGAVVAVCSSWDGVALFSAPQSYIEVKFG